MYEVLGPKGHVLDGKNEIVIALQDDSTNVTKGEPSLKTFGVSTNTPSKSYFLGVRAFPTGLRRTYNGRRPAHAIIRLEVDENQIKRAPGDDSRVDCSL